QFCEKCADRGCDSVITITLMHGRPGLSRGGDDPPNHAVETLLLDGERAGDRGAHRNFDRNHDVVAHWLDDPAESPERDVPSAVAGVLRAVDRQQNLLEDRLDVRLAPRGRLDAVLQPLGGRDILLTENDFDVEMHESSDPSSAARVFPGTPRS